MQEYFLYFLDKLDIVVLVRPFAGTEEAAAIAHAHTLSATHTIEVRDGERVVARIAKRTKPLRSGHGAPLGRR